MEEIEDLKKTKLFKINLLVISLLSLIIFFFAFMYLLRYQYDRMLIKNQLEKIEGVKVSDISSCDEFTWIKIFIDDDKYLELCYNSLNDFVIFPGCLSPDIKKCIKMENLDIQTIGVIEPYGGELDNHIINKILNKEKTTIYDYIEGYDLIYKKVYSPYRKHIPMPLAR